MKYYRYNKYRNKEREIHMIFNKKLFEKMQEDDKPNGYKEMLSLLIFILTVFVGFIITVHTDNVEMYSGIKIVGLGLVSQVVFWVGTYISKKIVQ